MTDEINDKYPSTKPFNNVKQVSEYWFRTIIEQNISIDGIIKLIQTYWNPITILKFDAKYMSNNSLKLIKDDTCIEVKDYGGQNHYALANCEPIKHGLHCWRIKVVSTQRTDPNWFLLGVSEQKEYDAKKSYKQSREFIKKKCVI